MLAEGKHSSMRGPVGGHVTGAEVVADTRGWDGGGAVERGGFTRRGSGKAEAQAIYSSSL